MSPLDAIKQHRPTAGQFQGITLQIRSELREIIRKIRNQKGEQKKEDDAPKKEKK